MSRFDIKDDKDFDAWNVRKKHVHADNENKLYHEREVRLIDTRRLINKVGFVDQKLFEDIRKAVKDLL